MNIDTVKLELLRSLPVGQCMWVRLGGTSMWPLLLAGDQVLVRRSDGSALRRGDMAAIVLANGVAAAHLVMETGPIRTAGTAGLDDGPIQAVIGRIEAVKRKGLRVPVTQAHQVLQFWPQFFVVARRVPGLPRLGRLLRRVL